MTSDNRLAIMNSLLVLVGIVLLIFWGLIVASSSSAVVYWVTVFSFITCFVLSQINKIGNYQIDWWKKAGILIVILTVVVFLFFNYEFAKNLDSQLGVRTTLV
jgi:hypothetical protein